MKEARDLYQKATIKTQTDHSACLEANNKLEEVNKNLKMQYENISGPVPHVSEYQKIASLEQEIKKKELEITRLREEVNREIKFKQENEQLLEKEKKGFKEKVLETERLRNEILAKDIEIQLQKDLLTQEKKSRGTEKEERKKTEEKIQEKETELSALKLKLENKENDNKRHFQNLRDQKDTIDKLNEEITKNQTKISALEALMNSLKDENQRCLSNTKEQEKKLTFCSEEKKRLEESQTTLSVDLARIREEVTKCTTERNQLHLEKESKSKDFTQIETKLKEENATLKKQLQKTEQDVQDRNQEIQNLQGKVKSTFPDPQAIPLTPEHGTIDSLKQQVELLKQEIKNRDDTKESEKKVYEDKIKALREDKIKQQLLGQKIVDTATAGLTAEIKKLKEENKKLRRPVQPEETLDIQLDLRRLAGEAALDVTTKAVEVQRSEIKTLQQKLEIKEGEIRNFYKQQKIYEQTNKRIEEREATIVKLSNDVWNLETQIKTLQENEAKLKLTLADTSQKLLTCNTEITKGKKERETLVETYSKEENAKDERIEKARKKAVACEEKNTQLITAHTKEKETLKNDCDTKQQEIRKENKEVIKEKEEKILELKKKEKELQEEKTDLKKDKDELFSLLQDCRKTPKRKATRPRPTQTVSGSTKQSEKETEEEQLASLQSDLRTCELDILRKYDILSAGKYTKIKKKEMQAMINLYAEFKKTGNSLGYRGPIVSSEEYQCTSEEECKQKLEECNDTLNKVNPRYDKFLEQHGIKKGTPVEQIEEMVALYNELLIEQQRSDLGLN